MVLPTQVVAVVVLVPVHLLVVQAVQVSSSFATQPHTLMPQV
jgi:hypothetical protein